MWFHPASGNRMVPQVPFLPPGSIPANPALATRDKVTSIILLRTHQQGEIPYIEGGTPD